MAKKKKSPAAEAARKEFAEALREFRIQRNYKTAYSFYHSRGAKAHFGFTYSYYLLIEQGERLPRIEYLETILTPGSSFAFRKEVDRILRLYMKASLDAHPMFEALFRAMGSSGVLLEDLAGVPADESQLLYETAVKKFKDVPLMSRPQAAALISSPAAYFIHLFLAQSGKEATPEKLAAAIVRPVQDVVVALELLLRHKLVKKKKGNRFFSPYFKSDLFFGAALDDAGRRQNMLFVSQFLQDRIRASSELSQEYYYGYTYLALPNKDAEAAVVQIFREAKRKAYLYRSTQPHKEGSVMAVLSLIGPLIRFKD